MRGLQVLIWGRTSALRRERSHKSRGSDCKCEVAYESSTDLSLAGRQSWASATGDDERNTVRSGQAVAGDELPQSSVRVQSTYRRRISGCPSTGRNHNHEL